MKPVWPQMSREDAIAAIKADYDADYFMCAAIDAYAPYFP